MHHMAQSLLTAKSQESISRARHEQGLESASTEHETSRAHSCRSINSHSAHETGGDPVIGHVDERHFNDEKKGSSQDISSNEDVEAQGKKLEKSESPTSKPSKDPNLVCISS
jgi:uncharacterized protein YraI